MKGDLFIAVNGDSGTNGGGPEIVTPSGKVVWFHPVAAGSTTDFQEQRYDGQPVLTWWQGGGFGGHASGADYIYNAHYQQIAVVHAGDGLSTDGHEFLITPCNTAIVIGQKVATANLTSLGGAADQAVLDDVVQDVDIATGRVLWQWDSADHVPYSESHVPLPTSPSAPWDWFHLNAVHFDTDGNLLIDSRYTWTVYKVDAHSGQIIWRLGGKDSSFTLHAAPGQSLDRSGEIFAWQHDPEVVGPDEYTVFDDESDGEDAQDSTARAVTVRLDLRQHTATLVASDEQPQGVNTPAQGNAQTLPSRDVVVGWGTLPYVSEFSPSGKLLYNAQYLGGGSSYRAFVFPWPPAESGN